MQNFSDLGLMPSLIEAVTKLGFTTPTPVQLQAIPFLLEDKRDLIALAQTGTGKTAAFGLPMLQQINFKKNTPQALVLAPTRELCVQISKDLTSFCSEIDNVNIVSVYGGASITDQIRKIQRGVQIVVATPGRLIDILGRNILNFDEIKILVLDEADEMLNMGFQEDIEQILATTPDDKRTWLFSATMPSEVRRIAQQFMNQPQEISMGKTSEGAENIRHVYYLVQSRQRYAALKRILDFSPELYGIVFCRTRLETQEIAEKLMKDGYNADAIHGDLGQPQRDKVMARFRGKHLQVLVATDVAARGIDVNNITHVVNYNLPDELENYTHRSGRTARAGKSGVSITLISDKEMGKMRFLEKRLNRKFLRETVPSGKEICELKLYGLMKKVLDVEVNEAEMETFLPQIQETLKDLSKEELVKRFAALEFNHLLEYYRQAPDLNQEAKPPHDGKERYVSGKEMFISLGKMDGLDRSSMLRFLCDVTGVDRNAIGRIDVKAACSFFEVEPEIMKVIEAAFEEGIEYAGRRVRVNVSAGPTGEGGGGGGYERKSYGGSKGYEGRNKSKSSGGREEYKDKGKPRWLKNR